MTAGLDLGEPDGTVAVFSARKIRSRLRAPGASAVAVFKETLAWGKQRLFDLFHEGAPADVLVHARSQLMDEVLCEAWERHLGAAEGLCVMAVGGYGRGELLPASDIDVLVLHGPDGLGAEQARVEQFLSFLWDIGLEVGAAVRTVAHCAQLASEDLTIITNLIESRRLVGDASLAAALNAEIAPEKIWPTASFFHAKLEEQKRRHAKYDDTGYKLEPNVKESPGGLRDIHTIVWVAKRHFASQTLSDLRAKGFLTQQECDELFAGQDFLWRVRFALHMLTGRHEDRLLFDHQTKVAGLFGYVDAEPGPGQRGSNRAVEQFMQLYYRTIKGLSCLNDILLQLFEQSILGASAEGEINVLNARFQLRGDVIEARDDRVFQDQPWALLEIFHLMQQSQEVETIAATTLRMIRRDLPYLDESVRNSARARALFMGFFHEGNGLTHALRRMNRYGVLGRYLPSFGAIVGLMQYDLFHTLTVDEHILYVVRNARRLAMPRFAHELPFASAVLKRLAKPELLYLGAFHHDLAKGRGGDHSELGAAEAEDFCLAHGLSHPDAELVAWLVQNHLLMSLTAQKQDVHDPEIIATFAEKVQTRERLDVLYLLTVSDIRGTNPKLWNSWRDSLLKDLYHGTARALDAGIANVPTLHERALRNRRHAHSLLLTHEQDEARADAFWQRLEDDYFLRHTPQEMLWHLSSVAQIRAQDLPLVLVKNFEDRGTSVFIYCHDRDHLFALTTGVLAQLGLNVLDARLHTTSDGYVLDSYVVLESDGLPVSGTHRPQEIIERLCRVLKDPQVSVVDVSRKPNSRLKHFSTPTTVHIHQDPSRNRTVLELVAADQPGLLSLLGRIFHKRGILLDAAKIATIGERAEDVFYLTNAQHQAITDEAMLEDLREVIIRTLD